MDPCGFSPVDHSHIDSMTADEMAQRLAADTVQSDEAGPQSETPTRSAQMEDALVLLEKGRIEVVNAALGKLDPDTKRALVEDFFNPGRTDFPRFCFRGLDDAGQARLFERIADMNARNAASFYQLLGSISEGKQELVAGLVAMSGTPSTIAEIVGRIAHGAPGDKPLDQRRQDVINITGLLMKLARDDNASAYKTAMSNITDEELYFMMRAGLTMSNKDWFKALPKENQDTIRVLLRDSLQYGALLDSDIRNLLAKATQRAIHSLLPAKP